MSTEKPTSSQKRQLVGLLELVCQELELTRTQFKDAKGKYEAVGAWLHRGNTIKMYGPAIVPQGSISLGTTVRPIGRDEFDIDLVCKLVYAGPEQDQAHIRRIVGERLKEKKDYAEMLEPLNRGWRLNYAQSGKFHLDITPAVMDRASLNGGLLVADRALKEWKPTNPEGYVAWFEGHASLYPQLVFKEDMTARMDVQPLPEPTQFKSVLKRTVQILKRHRDLCFQNKNTKNAPISIIITTLAAKSYAKAVTSRSYETEFDLLYDVVSGMNKCITVTNVAGRQIYLIPNETTTGENFAEKWNTRPERAEAYFAWQERAASDILMMCRQEGLDGTRAYLSETFGEKEVDGAFNRYTDLVTEARLSRRLRVDPAIGLSTLGGIRVRENTHFGK